MAPTLTREEAAMPLLSFVKGLLPKEDRYFDLLEAQADLACKAARALQAAPPGSLANESVRSQIEDLEHAGDAKVREMEDRLARSFVTPLDREDLQRLS